MNLKCLACGSHDIEQAFPAVGDYEYGTYRAVTYIRCSKCGLLAQDPKPRKGQIASFYPSDYRSHHKFNKKEFFYIVKNLQLWFFAKQIERLLTNKNEAEVLEIGCGNGSLLLAFKDMGVGHLWGTDISPVARNELLEKGIVFKTANIEVIFPFRKQFDMIILNHVFEHLLNPIFVLAACKAHLKKGGKIIIATPNSDSLDLALFNKFWDGINAPRHFYIFGVRSMTHITESLGFKKMRLFPQPDPGMWSISIQNVLQHIPIFRTRLKNGLAWYTLSLGILSIPLSLLTAFGRKSPNMLYVLE